MRAIDRDSSEIQLSPDHVSYCFEALELHFNHQPTSIKLPSSSHPLFVTWRMLGNDNQYHLRGCIGSLQPKQLPQAIHEYALLSALKDRRFAPVRREELPMLECTVSLLHNFEEAERWDKWIVGTHGIIANFQEPSTGQHRSATYLPDVASQEGWTQEEALQALVRKGGYRGKLQAVLPTLKITKYQSSTCSLTFRQFQEFKKDFTESGVQIQDFSEDFYHKPFPKQPVPTIEPIPFETKIRQKASTGMVAGGRTGPVTKGDPVTPRSPEPFIVRSPRPKLKPRQITNATSFPLSASRTRMKIERLMKPLPGTDPVIDEPQEGSEDTSCAVKDLLAQVEDIWYRYATIRKQNQKLQADLDDLQSILHKTRRELQQEKHDKQMIQGTLLRKSIL